MPIPKTEEHAILLSALRVLMCDYECMHHPALTRLHRKVLVSCLFLEMIYIYIKSREAFLKNILEIEAIEDFEAALEDKENAYTEFVIPKKNGERVITAIDSQHPLYAYQRNLYNKIFANFYLPNCAKGFIRGSGYKEFLQAHTAKQYFLRIDIAHFFDSISSKMIRDAIMFHWNVKETDSNIAITKEVIDDIVNACTLSDILPQGAVSSPAISNAVFTRTDQRITKYCQKLDIIYTRYADDLLFSSVTFDFKSKKWFLKMIKHILGQTGFRLNMTKTKYSHHEISLNGFVVCDSIRLSRKRFSGIICLLRYCEDNKNYLLDKKVDLFLTGINDLDIPYRNDSFNKIQNLLQYMLGYRSFLISWLDCQTGCTGNQKRILKILQRIESIASLLDSVLYPLV